MKEVKKVYQTYDYSMFKNMKGNRPLDKLLLMRLKKSFQKHYLFTIILVNEYYEIIDGQHRFEAAKSLGLPINFIVQDGYKVKEVQMLNTNTKDWGKMQYLHSYCELGNPVYLQFRNFMRKYPKFGIAVSEAILTGLSNGKYKTEDGHVVKLPTFVDGELQIPNIGKSYHIADQIMQIQPFYDGFNRITFVRAMIRLFNNANYDHSRFIKKLQIQPTKLNHCQSVDQYLLLIEDIYNYRSGDKGSLRY
jgi:hypothetical protein